MSAATYYLFYVIELLSYVGSYIWFLYAMPREIESRGWIRFSIWGIFAVLCTVIPSLWYNDGITMTVITMFYIVICWLFYCIL